MQIKKKTINHHFNGWLKAYQLAIDLREQISLAQGVKSRNRDQTLTGDKKDCARLEAPRARPLQGRENAALAAFSRPYGRGARRASGQGLSPGSLFPVAYKNPLGSSVGRYIEF